MVKHFTIPRPLFENEERAFFMPRKDLWSREELIVTLALYFQLPFGRLNHGTPEVKALAAIMGRTDNSVAIRLTNFAACDPYIINSGRHGMSAGVKVCQPIWDEFCNDKERLFLEAEIIKSKMTKQPIEKVLHISGANLQGKDRESVVKQRVNQNVFRTMILNNYESTCAITGINIPSMLIASHIIPWADDEENRLNPENGICLSPLYDKAFDKGYITFSPDDYRICLSSALLEYESEEYFDKHFSIISGRQITLPIEHIPNRDFLAYHKEKVFMGR